MVELCGIEPQSENKLLTASTCLEKLFGLIRLRTTCKARTDEPQSSYRGETAAAYIKKRVILQNPSYLESEGEAVLKVS